MNNAKFLPQPRVGLAWSPFRNTHTTVIRAGFGMYNDLQDALGYRTDQNAPFNPTYSLPNLSGLSASALPTAPVPATAKLVPGGVQPDLQTPDADFLVVPGPAGDHAEYRSDRRLRRLARISRDHRHRRERAVSGDLSGLAVPGDLSEQLSRPASRARRFPPGTYYVPTATKPNPALANTWTYFSEGDSSYNALQVDLNHRFSGGLVLARRLHLVEDASTTAIR